MHWKMYKELEKETVNIEIPSLLMELLDAFNRGIHKKEQDKEHTDFQLSAMLYLYFEKEYLPRLKEFDNQERFTEVYELWDKLQSYTEGHLIGDDDA